MVFLTSGGYRYHLIYVADHQLSKRTLLEICWASEDFENLWIQPENSPDHPWMLDFYINPPSADWVRVNDSGYSMEEILPHQTFIGIMDSEAKKYPTDSGERWRQMDPLWVRGSTQLIANIAVKEKYLEAMLLQGLDEGVQYLETRKALAGDGRLYRLNPLEEFNETFGKEFIDEDGEEDIKLAIDLIEKLKVEHPEFIGFKRISYSHRMADFNGIRETMERVLRFQQQYPEHIIGYDMVGEEDAGNSHLYYLDNFLELYDGDTGLNVLPMYLHVAETNWPADLMTSRTTEDLVATQQNTYESLLLNSLRVGHGLGFIKRPALFNLLKERNVAIDICPVSNQLLGFIADLRNHPAIHYFRSGHPIVLGSDDAGSFGVDQFTIDWYEVFMAWGLDLADLKQLALNSLQYSGMSQTEKTEAIEQKWTPAWNSYIQDMMTEACEETFDANPSFIRIIPREGALEGTTNVHIYGREFYAGICKDIKCRFGENESPASFISPNQIACEAPDVSTLLLTRGQRGAVHLYQEEEISVDVYVSFDGTSFVDTNQIFTYRHDPIVPPTPDEPGMGSAGQLSLNTRLVTITLLVMAYHHIPL